MQKIQIFAVHWRDARAVEWGGLENRCTCKGTQGSNPCLSANQIEWPPEGVIFSWPLLNTIVTMESEIVKMQAHDYEFTKWTAMVSSHHTL